MIDRFRLAAAAATLYLAAAGLPAHAQDAQFREVSAAAAVLYDGPSERARKLFIVVRGTPLEVLSTLNQWVKVRDQSGDVLWMQRGDLGEARHVVARALAAVRRAPQPNGELVVQVERGVLLEVVDASAPAGWLRVRHRDGASGFVSAAEVWGR
ncbi:MAG TPA: SH3 domain-containing protein [Burkholderiaceae bacterium]|mgnify:CR=1 FL=1|jgi:SH3-like domain-containing protein|nr:SH3 domain-containing protein [Burkholderiaceae bacterium]HRA77952.1 SH3 domain-containing protein [Burkholderiaceae bacterium]